MGYAKENAKWVNEYCVRCRKKHEGWMLRHFSYKLQRDYYHCIGIRPGRPDNWEKPKEK